MAQNGSMEMAYMNRSVSQPGGESVDDQQAEKKEEGRTGKNTKKQEVRRWLSDEVKLPQYCKVLVENGFDDLECFDGLTDAVLDSMSGYGSSNIKTGHRLRILRYVRKLEKVLP
eukprot:CAMPEP_0197061970 /NCGR_PEP_ID=MMETSP1384-20130603/140818_1 /TAXON_ID=29189 /ORGANISM="Ammonia sp." /LENGTH=113 /DNA_ID=CAMNT_0042497759 /DNA_START=1 /DNA_END=342 /DNA_ORIENTATION=-